MSTHLTTLGTVALSNYCIRTVGNITDLSDSRHLNLNYLSIHFVVRFLDQLHLHLRLDEYLAMPMIGSYDCKKISDIEKHLLV